MVMVMVMVMVMFYRTLMDFHIQIRKSLWSITEYPETSMLARVNAPNHHKAHHDKYHWTKYKEHSHHNILLPHFSLILMII